MNPIRVNFVRNSVAELHGRTTIFEAHQIKGLHILDVGCGGGLLSEALSRLGAIVTGIDPSLENIEVATRHCLRDPLTAGIEYKQATIGNYIFFYAFATIYFSFFAFKNR